MALELSPAGDDGKFGNVDARFLTDENPFGMDPDDPNGQDDRLVESNKVHLLKDQPVKVNLRSKDVLHNFTVTQFRVKMDLVPGLVSYLWLTPTKAGEFEVLCEELCGIGHFAMRGLVIVDEPADYDAWYASLPTYAEVAARLPGDPVVGQGQYAICVACHGPQGARPAVAERAQDSRPGGLVPASPVELLQVRCSRHPSGGHLRPANGPHDGPPWPPTKRLRTSSPTSRPSPTPRPRPPSPATRSAARTSGSPAGPATGSGAKASRP